MKLACIQTDVYFNDPAANAAALVAKLEALDVDLALWPESFLTGYCVATLEEAQRIAIPRDHDVISEIADACCRKNTAVVVGFAESDGDRVFNCAALIDRDGTRHFYRKTHLPFLGMDRFVTPGDELPLFQTSLGAIGVLICFDLRIPEACRALALAGAELVVLPTNWPEGAETSAEHVSITRAAENRIYMATCNRTGEENGFRFIGKSKIIDPAGRVMAAAGTGDEVIEAEIDLALARIKRNVNIPGEYETEVFATRQPALYSCIVRQD